MWSEDWATALATRLMPRLQILKRLSPRIVSGRNGERVRRPRSDAETLLPAAFHPIGPS